MKVLKIATFASLILASVASQANPNYHHFGHRHHGGSGWVAPLVIGSVVGYAIAARPNPVVVQQPPVVYPNTVPPVPYGYRQEYVLDANCNCYRLVLVPNQ